jgi:predicted dehydrogenase
MNPRGDLRVAIVGWGRAGSHLHAGALRGLPGVRLAAVADTDAEARARAAGVVGADRVHDDARRPIGAPDIDVVALCLPAAGRTALALEALAAGKHVLVEKPLAISADDCRRLVAAEADAARRGVRAMVGMNMRWHAQAREARDRIRDGAIGEVELVRSTITTRHDDVAPWRRARRTGGGVVLDMAIHHVDLWRWLTGDEVVEVFAYARSRRWQDDSAAICARMAGGALATAIVGERTINDNAMEIAGRDGVITLGFYRYDGGGIRSDGVPGDVADRRTALIRAVAGLPRLTSAWRGRGTWLAAYRAQWLHFADCIRRGRPPESTFADAARAAAIVRATWSAADTGASVRVEA